MGAVLIANKDTKDEVLISHLKMGAFSDLHIEPKYDPKISNLKFCKEGTVGEQNMTGVEEFISDNFSLLGRTFCNPPLVLFELMLKKMK